MKTISAIEIKKFQRTVRNFYTKQGRTLPWRKTHNPYHILVSELMLQQTQVERVIPKYKTFLKEFPTLQSLSKAPLSKVLHLWQGLGYNRRAKYLHQAAQYFVSKQKGVMKKSEEELRKAPGVGPYTASAIMAFAFDLPTVMIETNIRTVMIHHFGGNKNDIPDTDIRTLVQTTLPKDSIREWYSALMDYGTHLKKNGVKTNARVKGYKKQSPLKGSRREIRGVVIKHLTKKPYTHTTLLSLFPERKEEVVSVLSDLIREGFITKQKNLYAISS